MRNVLKAALTVWYALLMMFFLLAAATSALAVLQGFEDGNDSATGAGALGLLAFGWGVRRYIIVCYATGRGCPLCTLEHDTHTQSTKMDAILDNQFYAYEHGDENYPLAGAKLSFSGKYAQKSPRKR
jgi:uncharacterized protein (TIGR03382 family)